MMRRIVAVGIGLLVTALYGLAILIADRLSGLSL